MWDCVIESLHDGRTQRYSPRRDGSPVSYADVIHHWQGDEAFRSFFIALLTDSGFTGYRWETPPVDKATADREFEFVLIDTAGFDAADHRAFAKHFSAADKAESVVTFANLGKDAVLVVPCSDRNLYKTSVFLCFAAHTRKTSNRGDKI